MKDKILELIYSAIDELNHESGDETKIEKSPNTVLYGKKSVFDSLTIVSFLVIIEKKMEEEFGVTISALDGDNIISKKTSPLKTIGTFADYLSIFLKDKDR